MNSKKLPQIHQKPENLLLDKYGDFKVNFWTGDKISDHEKHKMLTQQTGAYIYFAPEIRVKNIIIILLIYIHLVSIYIEHTEVTIPKTS